jgi:4-hydroxyacetophenone monooxygenase
LSDAAQAVVREAIAGVLDELADGRRSLPPPLAADELARMMSVCVGENVPRDYTDMTMEEMGFASREVRWNAQPAGAELERFRVLVVGCGFSGLCAAGRLRELGIAFDIVDKNPELGGTWFENNYPEAGVDTPNHYYSYSFAPNLTWTSNYSKRDEVVAYQRAVADKLGLRERIEFGVQVEQMRWDDEQSVWEICLRDANGVVSQRRYQAVISATGQLNQPKIASIRGLEQFAGPTWHSARWRHDVPLEGKRIAVVGTGASAMQFLRSVAARAAKVTVFQRSPQWARPPQDYHGTVSHGERWLLENIPYYYPWYRFGLMWRFGDGLLPTVRRDPSWPHPERAMNYRNDRQRQQMTEYLLAQLEGRPDLVAKCLPDYPPYGKRILIDNGWYQALKRPNVELVTEAVDRIETDAVIAADGSRHEVDAIILATGFEAARMLGSMTVLGRSGQPLAEAWSDDDPRAYLGITVPDYPNLFVTYGPNTGLAHGGSLIFVIECQVRYITTLLRNMIERSVDRLEVRRDVHDRYIEKVDAEHAELVWTHPGMNNWYRNRRGRVFGPMPFRLVDYWRFTREPDLDDFEARPRRASLT